MKQSSTTLAGPPSECQSTGNDSPKTNVLRLKLELSRELLSPTLPSFMCRSLIPIDLDSVTGGKSGATIRNLMGTVYKQVKPMLKKGVDASKLYFATSDGFFLPPNGLISTTWRPDEPLHMLTWQTEDSSPKQ